MALIALVGSLTFFLKEELLEKCLLPMVSLAAGALLGGAFFHMLPEAIERGHNSIGLWISLVLGFLLFFILEQFLNWHHTHNPSEAKPMTYLILLADGLHNFIGGVSVGAAFLIDVRIPVPLLPKMALHQKQNMREHLESVQGVIDGLTRKDFRAIEASASKMGFTEEMGRMCERMGAGAPGFTEQALSFHKSADLIAAAARKLVSPWVREPGSS